MQVRVRVLYASLHQFTDHHLLQITVICPLSVVVPGLVLYQSSVINFIARLNDSPVLCGVEIWLNLLFVTAYSHSDGTKDKNEACHQWHAATVLASSSYF